jgi:hypothetical protein
MKNLYKNMHINKIILALVVLFWTAHSEAQVGIQTGQHSSILLTQNLEPHQVDVIDGIATMRYSNSAAIINGSPYLTTDFVEGTMTTLDGTVIPGLKYRYDIYGDEMQFIVNIDTATINKPLALSSVEFEDHKFVYEVFLADAGRVATGYFEVIEENTYLTVLYRRQIKLEQDVYVPNYGGGGGSKEFKMKKVNSYYVKPIESAALQIRNKKDFLNSIPDYRDEVKKYMKDHKISVKKEEDLQKVAIYYNRIHTTGS